MQIEGEWSFSNSDRTANGLLPSKWSPGDFPLAVGGSVQSAVWPIATMTKNGQTGVWSYTTPLPSGVFTYRFFVDCSSSTQTGCTGIADPSNPPWNSRGGATKGSVQPTSQVYVPSDPRFGTIDYSWEAPNRAHGSLVDVSYPSALSIDPQGTHPLAVYTPPGYDPHQAKPYPTVYLSHGYGGNETDWATQGDAGTNEVGIFVGGGTDDPIHSVAEQEAQGLQALGLRPTTDFINGGHDWFVWRVLFRDFLTRVAFKPVT